MTRSCLVLATLTLACCAFLANGYSIQPKKRPQFTDDVLELMEPAIVPDSVDGRPWWYTPTRYTRTYAHHQKKYQRRFNNINKGLVGKQEKITDEELYRLPTDILPTRYAIQLLPHIELIPDGVYVTDGEISIFINCIRDTNNITMNAVALTFDESATTVLDMETEMPIEIKTPILDEQSTRQMITIQTTTPLQAEKSYKVIMKYTSVLNDLDKGFYRSSYVENGVTKWLAVTDFESSDARRAFPCFDEPNMKAEFSIVLGRHESMTSVSNMEQLSTNPIPGMPGYVWDYYKTSVKMSTYLVACIVSEFVDVPSEPGLSNVQFRVWARPEAEPLTQYAGNIGPRILEFYESYFNISYPLSKEDFAAIPDFTAGAMENWGLITFREPDLLIDTETASASQIQRVAVVSAHELAHQWFGDLVTLDWWNTIWLNEGFASYFEFFGTDAVEKGFRMFDQFVVANLQYVFGVDSLETSRPMHSEVTVPDQINYLFDAISYDKASCVIRMMADFVGLDTFNRALNRYLTTDAYANGKEDDLWKAMDDQIAEEGNVVLPTSVKEIMDTWVLQMGYPVINVTRNYEDYTAKVTQERFLSRKSDDSTDTHVYRWWVPLTYTTAANPSKRTTEWLSKEEDQKVLSISGALNVQWVIFNVDQQNYYRVAYDEINYNMIAAQLLANHLQISDNNRAQVLDDAFNLALADMIPYKWALDLSLYLKSEEQYVPWNAVLSELNYIDTMLHNEKEYTDWKLYVTDIIEPYYNLVGFEENESDEHLTIYSRTDAMKWACKLGIQDCVTKATAQYAALIEQPDLVLSPNQRSQIIRTGVENGFQDEWDFAYEQYKTTGDTTFLVAMTYTKQSSILYNTLELMLNPESGIYEGNINTLFSNIAANPLGNDIALNFMINRWDDIETALGQDYFVNFFRYLCDRPNTQSQLDKLTKLRDDHSDILGSSQTVQQGIDVVMANIQWMQLNRDETADWLKQHQPTASTLPIYQPTTTTPTTTSITTPTTTSITTPTATSITTPTTTSTTTSTSTSTTASTTTTPATTPTTAPTSLGNVERQFFLVPFLLVLLGYWISV